MGGIESEGVFNTVQVTEPPDDQACPLCQYNDSKSPED
jgi:hypothetical protein